MGGTSSEHWREFNRLLLVGMMSARKHMDRIINFVEIMRSSKFRSKTTQNMYSSFYNTIPFSQMLICHALRMVALELYRISENAFI